MANMFDGIPGPSQICSRRAAWHPFARESRVVREAAADQIQDDRVELSEAAIEANHGRDAQRIRDESVERIRRSIAAGDYLTSEKIDATVERLYEVLSGQSRFRDAQAPPALV